MVCVVYVCRAVGLQYLSLCRFVLVSDPLRQVLELHSNALGPMGATALANALRSNTCVRALNFNDNELMDEGAEALAGLLRGTSLRLFPFCSLPLFVPGVVTNIKLMYERCREQPDCYCGSCQQPRAQARCSGVGVGAAIPRLQRHRVGPWQQRVGTKLLRVLSVCLLVCCSDFVHTYM